MNKTVTSPTGSVEPPYDGLLIRLQKQLDNSFSYQIIKSNHEIREALLRKNSNYVKKGKSS